MNKDDAILFQESIDMNDNHSPLVGEISIYRKNKKTGETTLHEKSKNVISISGYQWILMKMFGLYLDSNHGEDSDPEDMGKDSTIIIPDLNNSDQMNIGIDPDAYTAMESDISERHFIQGFMIGNGGSAEDAITAKNTNYSFTKLRNAIPFRQTTQSNELTPVDANKYLGIYRPSVSSNDGVKSYYIKKFDDRPHIYHSWWRDGQRWDYVDPVTQNDLGPNAQTTAKTNRIESYIETHLSLDENDCVSYFNHDGNTATAQINELGLVAFDTIPGTLSIVERVYDTHVKKMIKLIFANEVAPVETVTKIQTLASEIKTVLTGTLGETQETHMVAFLETLDDIADLTTETENVNIKDIQDALALDTNIHVQAYYNPDHTFMYATDEFKTYTDTAAYYVPDQNIADEAQRIKLITYYTFNSLPIQSDWEILIYYRIYAN